MADNQAILKVSMADESTFASIASTTGQPDWSGLSFTEIEFESAELVIQPLQEDRAPTRCSTAEAPPQAGEWRNSSGTPYQIRRAVLTLKVAVDNVGSSGLAVTDLASYKLAATLLLDDPPPAASSVVTTGVSTTRGTMATNADWEYGALVGVSYNGRQVSTRCTGTTGGDKILSPALPAAPANGSTARFFHQLYAKSTWSSTSKAFRLDGLGMRWYALGCAASDITWETSKTGTIYEVVTMQVAQCDPDHGNADPTCDGLGVSGLVRPNMLNSYHSMSTLYAGEGGTLVEPAESPRLAIQVEGWKVSLSVPTTPDECTDNAIGMIGWRRAGGITGTIDIPMCTAEASAFANDRANKARRQLHLNAGPHAANNGFALAFGGVWHRSDPSIRERGPDIWRQKLSLGIGDYSGDTDSGVPAASVDAYMIVGWGR